MVEHYYVIIGGVGSSPTVLVWRLSLILKLPPVPENGHWSLHYPKSLLAIHGTNHRVALATGG